MEHCPVCQTEYDEGIINFCITCGWDLKPCSLPEQMHEIFSQKERVRLTWARGVWLWASEMRSQLQLQSKLCETEAQLQQATQQAMSQRSHLQSQLSQVLEQTRLEQLQEVISAVSS